MPLWGTSRVVSPRRTDADLSELKFYIVSLSINAKPAKLATWPMMMRKRKLKER